MLDEGECEALALAEEVGTLGMLAEAAAEGLIDLPVVVSRLQQTSFYVAPDLLQSLLNRFKR